MFFVVVTTLQPKLIEGVVTLCVFQIAERVAAERGESLGESVGYQIRLEA